MLFGLLAMAVSGRLMRNECKISKTRSTQGIEKFFYNDLRREFVDDILIHDGDYLVRRASNTNAEVISVKFNGKVEHFQPKFNGKQYSFGHKSFSTLFELIRYYSQNKVPLCVEVPAILVKPAARMKTTYENSDIEIMAKLGEGNFGKVFKVKITSEDRLCAMKTLKANVTNEVRETFMKEFNMMKTMRHPNVVQCIGVVVAGNDADVKILLELVNKGSLDRLLREGKLTDRGKSRITLDVATGMQYLHSRGIIHRDLAARNILVQRVKDGSIIGKVSDFGLSQADENGKGYCLKGPEQLPLKWLAPECLVTKLWTSASDVWSFGVFMWEVWTDGKEPYSENKTLTEAQALKTFISRGGHPQNPEFLLPSIRRIILACWTIDVKKRPNMDWVLTEVEKAHRALKGDSETD